MTLKSILSPLVMAVFDGIFPKDDIEDVEYDAVGPDEVDVNNVTGSIHPKSWLSICTVPIRASRLYERGLISSDKRICDKLEKITSSG